MMDVAAKEGARGVDGGLEVLYQPSIELDPGEEPLNDPAAGVYSEADLVGIFAHDFDGNQRGLGDLLTGIPAVSDDPLDATATVRRQHS